MRLFGQQLHLDCTLIGVFLWTTFMFVHDGYVEPSHPWDIVG